MQKLRIGYNTNHYNGAIFNGFVGNDLPDGVTVYAPVSADEKRDPRKEDIYISKKLIEHFMLYRRK